MTESGQPADHPGYRFPKKEKLTGKKNIEGLFENGSSFYLHPLLMKYAKEHDPAINCHRLLFTVSKRNFKSAVKRNLIKRRLREAYRLNRSILSSMAFYQIAFVYLGKSIVPYQEMEDKLKSLLQRLQDQTSGSNEN